jgi:hypothetical protein
MNETEIIDAAAKLEKKIRLKGYENTNVKVFIWWCGYDFTIFIERRSPIDKFRIENFIYGKGGEDTLASMFEKANDFADSLKDINDVKKSELINSIDKLIKDSREIGIDSEHINALVEMSGKLSEKTET